ncbi:hypothetical protein GCM10008931_44110 [Oceanobacillus oncorhynchi subsp. oncorhynchi]|uniref:replicative DNA helicase n=1 Tax=Oceanobacillus oncorhynchi TaxID=545501 RepID=UPI0031E3F456
MAEAKKVKSEDVLKSEVYASEALLVSLFWKYPEFYLHHPEDKIGSKTFGNKIWAFFFNLGRKAHQKELGEFDELSVSQLVKEFGVEATYKKYGEYEFIYENIEYVKDKKDNFEKYYEDVKKYKLLRDFRDIFGDKVLHKTDKYNYHKLNRFQIQIYWQDKVNEIALTNDAPIKEYNLFDISEMREMVDRIDEESSFGMPLYGSDKMTEILQGWGDSTLTILSGFSGNGKSSYTVYSVVLGCLTNKERLVIIANEMGCEAYRKLALVTVMGSNELYEKTNGLKGFDRKAINKGNFSDDEKKRLHIGIDWIEENLEGDNALVKLIPLDAYTMDNVEQILRHYSHRGYSSFILDTAKPTEGGGNTPRWQKFTEDFEKLETLKKDDVGLGIKIFATVQAADEAIRMRFLDERCLGDSKKIKNVADGVVHMRPVRTDELDGGKFEIEVYEYVSKDTSKAKMAKLKSYGWEPDPTFKSSDKPYWRLRRSLDKEGNYYLFFCSKNRRNTSNLTGLDVLVLRVDFNSNKWKEIGWTNNVARDVNY